MASVWIKRVAVVSIALVLAVFVGANMLGLNPLRGFQRGEPAVLKSVRDISQYDAAVGTFEVVVNDEQGNVPGLPTLIAGRKTLFVAAGTVNAYVDLAGVAENDLSLSEDGKSVAIRLPHAQLDKPNLDHDRSYVFMQERGVLDRINDALGSPEQEQFYKRAEEKLTAAAEESELRTRQSRTPTPC
ncbi:DUF4230 domain-containing protein [Sinomonas atrocyanea]|uniref:DUF4230 domain-containing protein n=1 Tax=Sinomonas atrocyanea TaxID=37927 RepID=UPI003D9937D5